MGKDGTSKRRFSGENVNELLVEIGILVNDYKFLSDLNPAFLPPDSREEYVIWKESLGSLQEEQKPVQTLIDEKEDISGEIADLYKDLRGINADIESGAKGPEELDLDSRLKIKFDAFTQEIDALNNLIINGGPHETRIDDVLEHTGVYLSPNKFNDDDFKSASMKKMIPRLGRLKNHYSAISENLQQRITLIAQFCEDMTTAEESSKRSNENRYRNNPSEFKVLPSEGISITELMIPTLEEVGQRYKDPKEAIDVIAENVIPELINYLKERAADYTEASELSRLFNERQKNKVNVLLERYKPQLVKINRRIEKEGEKLCAYYYDEFIYDFTERSESLRTKVLEGPIGAMLRLLNIDAVRYSGPALTSGSVDESKMLEAAAPAQEITQDIAYAAEPDVTAPADASAEDSGIIDAEFTDIPVSEAPEPTSEEPTLEPRISTFPEAVEPAPETDGHTEREYIPPNPIEEAHSEVYAHPLDALAEANMDATEEASAVKNVDSQSGRPDAERFFRRVRARKPHTPKREDAAPASPAYTEADLFNIRQIPTTDDAIPKYMDQELLNIRQISAVEEAQADDACTSVDMSVDDLLKEDTGFNRTLTWRSDLPVAIANDEPPEDAIFAEIDANYDTIPPQSLNSSQPDIDDCLAIDDEEDFINYVEDLCEYFDEQRNPKDYVPDMGDFFYMLEMKVDFRVAPDMAEVMKLDPDEIEYLLDTSIAPPPVADIPEKDPEKKGEGRTTDPYCFSIHPERTASIDPAPSHDAADLQPEGVEFDVNEEFEDETEAVPDPNSRPSTGFPPQPEPDEEDVSAVGEIWKPKDPKDLTKRTSIFPPPSEYNDLFLQTDQGKALKARLKKGDIGQEDSVDPFMTLVDSQSRSDYSEDAQTPKKNRMRTGANITAQLGENLRLSEAPRVTAVTRQAENPLNASIEKVVAKMTTEDNVSQYYLFSDNIRAYASSVILKWEDMLKDMPDRKPAHTEDSKEEESDVRSEEEESEVKSDDHAPISEYVLSLLNGLSPESGVTKGDVEAFIKNKIGTIDDILIFSPPKYCLAALVLLKAAEPSCGLYRKFLEEDMRRLGLTDEQVTYDAYEKIMDVTRAAINRYNIILDLETEKDILEKKKKVESNPDISMMMAKRVKLDKKKLKDIVKENEKASKEYSGRNIAIGSYNCVNLLPVLKSLVGFENVYECFAELSKKREFGPRPRSMVDEKYIENLKSAFSALWTRYRTKGDLNKERDGLIETIATEYLPDKFSKEIAGSLKKK